MAQAPDTTQVTTDQKPFPPYEPHWFLQFFDGNLSAVLIAWYGIICFLCLLIVAKVSGKGFTRGTLLIAAVITLGLFVWGMHHNGTGMRGVPIWLGRRTRMGDDKPELGNANIFRNGTQEGIIFAPLPSFLLDFESVDCRTQVLNVTGTSNTKDNVPDAGIPITQGVAITDPHLYLGIINPAEELDELLESAIRPIILDKNVEVLYAADRGLLAREVNAKFHWILTQDIGKFWGISAMGQAKVSGPIKLPADIAALLAGGLREALQRRVEQLNIEARVAQIEVLTRAGVDANTAAAMVSAEAGISGGTTANTLNVRSVGQGGGRNPNVHVVTGAGAIPNVAGGDDHH